MKKYLFVLMFTFVMIFIFSTFKVNAQNYFSCFDLQNDMQIGSIDSYTNGEVTQPQSFLNSISFLEVEPTGYFGTLTRRALIAYQTSKGLYNIGFLGPLTRAVIYNTTCFRNYNPQIPSLVPAPTPNPILTPISNITYCDLNTIYTGTNYCTCPSNYTFTIVSGGYKCVTNQQSINTIAPDNCKIWYDGCNTCSRSSIGGRLACTMMYCSQNTVAYCRDYFLNN